MYKRQAVLRLIEGDCVLNIMCGKLIRRALIEREHIRLVSGVKMAEDALFNLETVLCARNIAYVHHVASVSYTHLDVYKRQDFTYGLNKGDFHHGKLEA